MPSTWPVVMRFRTRNDTWWQRDKHRMHIMPLKTCSGACVAVPSHSLHPLPCDKALKPGGSGYWWGCRHQVLNELLPTNLISWFHNGDNGLLLAFMLHWCVKMILISLKQVLNWFLAVAWFLTQPTLTVLSHFLSLCKVSKFDVSASTQFK